LFVLASVTDLQRKSTFAKTPGNSLKRPNTTLLDSPDLKIFKKQNINEKKIINKKDKSSNCSMSPLIDCNNDVDNDQCSSEICESMLFNNEYQLIILIMTIIYYGLKNQIS